MRASTQTNEMIGSCCHQHVDRFEGERQRVSFSVCRSADALTETIFAIALAEQSGVGEAPILSWQVLPCICQTLNSVASRGHSIIQRGESQSSFCSVASWE